MNNIFLKLVKKKDEIKKLIYIISQASLTSLLILLIFAFISSNYPSFGNKIEDKYLYLIILVVFLVIVTLAYIENFTKILTKLEEFYPKVPLFLIGMGSLIFLVLFYITTFIPFFHTYVSSLAKNALTLSFIELILFLVLALISFSIFLIPVGIILLFISLFAKRYLEGQVLFTLTKANLILDQVEDKNRIDTRKLNRYIYLSYKNIKSKFGKGLNLKPSAKSDGESPLDLEYTFLNCLPVYIEYGCIEQRRSLKKNLEIMLKLVKEKDEIDFRSLTSTILELNKDIRIYLKEVNLEFTPQELSRQSEWMLRNKDTIFQAISLIVSIILLILSKYYPPKGT